MNIILLICGFLIGWLLSNNMTHKAFAEMQRKEQERQTEYDEARKKLQSEFEEAKVRLAEQYKEPQAKAKIGFRFSYENKNNG